VCYVASIAGWRCEAIAAVVQLQAMVGVEGLYFCYCCQFYCCSNALTSNSSRTASQQQHERHTTHGAERDVGGYSPESRWMVLEDGSAGIVGSQVKR